MISNQYKLPALREMMVQNLKSNWNCIRKWKYIDGSKNAEIDHFAFVQSITCQSFS